MRRRLSPTERFVWAAGEALPVNFALVARIRGRTTPNLLCEALSAARRRHPLLGARIGDPGRWQAWLTTRGTPEPQLRVVRATAGSRGASADGDEGAQGAGGAEGWTRVLEEELQRRFDTEAGPLARFVMVDHGDAFDLVAIYHHLVADGLSACFVLRDILRYLTAPEPLPVVRPLVAPPADDLLPGPRARLSDLRTVARQMREGGRPSRTGGQLAARTWSLAAWETSALVTRCRAEGTTLQAALNTAFARALADLGSAAPATIAVPADLRRTLSPSPGEALGLYATTLLNTVDGAALSTYWETARDAYADIRRRLRLEELLPFVRVYRLLPFLPRATVSKALWRSESEQARFDLSLSTMRPGIPSRYGPLCLEAVHCLAHTSLSGAPLITAIRKDGRLFFGAVSTDGQRTAELCAHAMSHLRQAVTAALWPSPSGGR
ncbi:hypothetical protein [Streptomyces daliensis]